MKWLQTGAVLLLACTFVSVTTCFESDVLSSWPRLWLHLQDKAQASTLTDLAKKLNESTLTKFLEDAGLDKTLSDPTARLTLFGPTDAAFGKLPEVLVNKLTSNVTLLTSVLTYHVLAVEVKSTALKNELLAKTVNGQNVRVNIYGTGEKKVITVNGARVTKPDNIASNGVLHVIDKVLLPPIGNLVTSFDGCPEFSTLITAVRAAGLVDTLKGPGPFTLFAPTNDAFAKLPPGTLDGLLANVTALTNVLTYHVVPGTFYSAGLTNGLVKTVNGQSVTITVNDDGVGVNNAKVEVPDVVVTNGVAHVINEVLIPKGMTIIEMMFQPYRKYRLFNRL